jgi:catechol 2,3-dioxygenase-like lactoylglutathione lyase family enzyme
MDRADSRRVAQLALVVRDYRKSADFYARIFGLDHIFGTSAFRGKAAESVQGVPGAASTTRWLIDGRKLFQLEIFQFDQPVSRPLPADREVCDLGYNRLIIAVRSLADIDKRAREFSGIESSAIETWSADGRSHAILRDPDGILLELVQAPELVPRERPAMLVGLGLTTPDMTTTVEDLCQGFGFTPNEDIFEHHRNWSVGGRLQATQTLQLGDMFLVISQYREARPRPSDYRLSDIGIMNFAVGFHQQDEFDRCYKKTLEMGMSPNCEPVTIKDRVSVVYNNLRHGFSVEMIFMAESYWGLYGFARPGITDRLMTVLLEWKGKREYSRHHTPWMRGGRRAFSHDVVTSIEINGSPEVIWDTLSQFDAYQKWNPMLRNVRTELKEGAKVSFEVLRNNGRKLKLNARIVKIDKTRNLAWRGGNSAILSGEHYFSIEQVDESRCTFHHGEHFRGALMPLFLPALKNVESRYQAMNNAIKQRVESGGKFS